MANTIILIFIILLIIMPLSFIMTFEDEAMLMVYLKKI